LKDESSLVRGHANAVTLQGKTQDQAQGDETQKSKNNNLSNKEDKPSKKGARKCVCEDIHEFEECSYIVSSARKPDWTEDKKILDQIKQKLQEKPWILKVIKRICNTNILDEATTPPAELNDENFRFDGFSFANTVLRESTSLNKSVIYDSGCSDSLTYDKDRFLREIKSVSKDIWIKTPNDRMKVEGYGTMQVLEKLGDKQIRMKFANTAYVLITRMTLVFSTKLIKEGYDRDMHTKTLVHVVTEKKVCDIEKHFGVMTLEYNLINESTAIVEMTAPKINEVLNETSNKKIEVLNNQASKEKEVLNNQAPTKEKEVEKTPQFITNSESITHEKSGTELHIMKLNQSDEEQRNKPSLNNSHSSRQIDSGSGEDHFIKAPNTKNGDPKRHFIKAPNLKNGGPKKQAKSSDITRHKNPNRTEKAWWRSLTNGVQITSPNEVKKRPPIEGFSGVQYGFSKHAHQGMQHRVKLGQKRDNVPKRKPYSTVLQSLFQRFKLI
jgi:hypothetical protein